MDKFLAARSFHASMHMEGAQTMTNEMDFVAPDRYRMQMTAGTQVIIGDTMYMETRGKRMQVPLPAGTISQWRDPLKIQENKEGLSVEAQGSETIDGQAARKYLVRNTVPESTEFTYWISSVPTLFEQIQLISQICRNFVLDGSRKQLIQRDSLEHRQAQDL